MADDPLVPLEGEVIDLADVILKRGRPPLFAKSCGHKHLIYSTTERRIWCKDCSRTVDGFDAFMVLVDQWGAATKDIERRRREVDEASKHVLISRAAKAVDEIWRGRSMAPCCPSCQRGLLPEDFTRGVACMSRELEVARRRKERETRI